MKTEILEKFYNWIIVVGPKIVMAIIIFIIGQWMIKLLRRWATHTLNKKSFNPSVRAFLRSLLFAVLQVLLILLVMQVVGLQLTVFTALVGAFGVAAGLALSGTLQNFTSGILILFLRPYKVGDNIIAQGQEGTVRSIEIFYTVIITYDNKTVIIPNSKLSNELIINLSEQGKRRLDIEIKFPLAIAYSEVRELIMQSLSSADAVLKDPPPAIGVSLIEQDGYKVKINAWLNSGSFEETKLMYHQKLLEKLKNAHIKLPGL